ncbi:hypothetical protein J2S43_002717 [Catenuloplanes nepalensis]|uniref:Serine protease n=1 Tax=Catenuloplanes nepalensis TaxID=587533 RepID=A0ABT9MS24_9ACTN|nr:serine protease [Catenuloplanes nepalensis]MDP9794205.1 hypothetical protein [Catenuloplanes nepalensis]
MPTDAFSLPPWVVRVCGDDGATIGAGILLPGEFVLTCAHVVDPFPVAGRMPPPVRVTFADLPVDDRGVPAEVVPDAWVPRDECTGGDLALLRVAEPCHRRAATLLSAPLPDGAELRAYGFPASIDSGVWATVRPVARGGPCGEWMQLEPAGRGVPVQRGFSGTGVVDPVTERVIGMVVSEFKDEGIAISWMIPVDTIIGYLPMIRRFAEGPPALDGSFQSIAVSTGNTDVLPGQPDAGDRLARWLAEEDDAPALLVVVAGDAGSAASVDVHRVVLTADRTEAPALRAAGIGGPDVPPGSVDLAVDAAGLGADDLIELIARRAGVSPPALHDPGGAPPMTVVVSGVDEAHEPERLVHELRDLIESREERVRVVLVFRRGGSVAHRTAEKAASGYQSAPPDPWIDARLDELAAQEQAMWERYVETARRVADVPRPGRTADLLRAQAGQRSRHPSFRDRIDEARSRAAATVTALDALLARRAELRQLLGAYRDRAIRAGHVEDRDLDELHRAAYRLLHRNPCDLPGADAAVRRYAEAIRDKGVRGPRR